MKKKKVILLIAGVMLLACIGASCERSSREEGSGETMGEEKAAEGKDMEEQDQEEQDQEKNNTQEMNTRENNTEADSSGEKTLEENQTETDSLTAGSEGSLSGTVPDELEYIPSEYEQPAEHPGTLEKLTYQTWESFSYDEHAQELTKEAWVYLPYGYSEEQKYNVFYLSHGGLEQ